MTGRWRAQRRGEPDTGTTHPPGLHLVHNDTYADWDAIYLDNVTWIHRLMFAKVGNRPDAEDLTAEVFLTVLRPLRTSATVAEVRAYLARTARTVLAAYWRRTLGLELTTIDVAEVADHFPDPPESKRASGRAQTILAQLPQRYRAVLELRFLRSYSIRETAAELGLSVANVKVIQHRALRLAAETDEAVTNTADTADTDGGGA
jgi:RNA polymerase sigma factor (sigma-70 family)